MAACYFPTTRKEYPDVKEKLLHDKEGVEANGAQGLAFFVNQPVTPSQRAELAEMVEPYRLELYHLERMRSILDSPKGYGIRLEYLRIPMSGEEQLSLLSVINFRVDERLKEQTREIAAMRHALQQVRMRTEAAVARLTDEPSSFDTDAVPIRYELPTSDLSLGDLKWVHRLLTEGGTLPLASRGQLRRSQVWIGGPRPEEASFIPLSPEEVETAIEELLADWRAEYSDLIGADQDVVVSALARFHHRFLSIHPFLDGNGRIARALLQQQAAELMDKWLAATFREEAPEYFATLSAADQGDIEPLERLISANLE